MKNIFIIIFLTIASMTFGQIKLGEVNDSTVATFTFCLIQPEISDGYVHLKCSDQNGPTISMEVREDIFHGKINIIITPNEELGPITEEKTVNWFMLPEKKDTTNVKIQQF